MVKRLLSGIRISGVTHIGNYFVSFQQYVQMQEDYESLAMLADLHALTTPYAPGEIENNTLATAKLYLACGLDPNKTIIFAQSHVPEHAELAWILSTVARMGELSRMTQFKEKAATFKGSDLESEGGLTPSSVNLGLFAYPVLMAADILIYKADVVPVGEDQKQHVEITRDLAQRFNRDNGKVFTVPEIKLRKDAARIMGLDDPNKKMSKSADSDKNYISLLDDAAAVTAKIKAAVTDSGNALKYDEKGKPAISNLINIYSLCTGKTHHEIESEFSGKSYGEFKNALTEALIDHLRPIQEKYRDLSDEIVKDVLIQGATNARAIAAETLKEVKTKIGLLQI